MYGSGDSTTPTDHPRSRGVYASSSRIAALTAGSSPLARGLPCRPSHLAAKSGIIPARAGFTTRGRLRVFRPGDHPRSRGVYGRSRWGRLPAHGSSPLARGLRSRRTSETHVDGIIPARAGFTPRGGPPTGRSRDHPRSRGVYPPVHPPFPTHVGSSPLARGLLELRRHVLARLGIIPARAGFTPSSPTSARTAWDHPRSRGVYRRRRSGGGNRIGSSPLARGLHVLGITEDKG